MHPVMRSKVQWKKRHGSGNICVYFLDFMMKCCSFDTVTNALDC